MTDIDVQPLPRTTAGINRFLQVSYVIYRDDPLWVAPLLSDLKRVFTDENPLFEHAEMQLWVATEDGRDVGRIAGVLDRSYKHPTNEQAAFFGFFESVNNPEV